MKRTIALFAAIVLVFSLCGCSSKTDEPCAHNYYLSDIVDATSKTTGVKTFTCSKCGNTYTEVIPRQEDSSVQNSTSKETEPEEDLTRKRSVNLFDYPQYSNKNVITGITDKLKYSAEETDVDGWKHTDCYMVCGSTTEAWVRYEINGKYTTLSGSLFDANTSGGSGWLEFYDGDEFIAATKRVGDGTSSTEFEIDITGVEYLTVHFCSTHAGTWMIADDVILTK